MLSVVVIRDDLGTLIKGRAYSVEGADVDANTVYVRNSLGIEMPILVDWDCIFIDLNRPAIDSDGFRRTFMSLASTCTKSRVRPSVLGNLEEMSALDLLVELSKKGITFNHGGFKDEE